MKFALFILASWSNEERRAQRRVYSEALEQIQYAEELGFDSVWIAEHHSSRYGIFPSLNQSQGGNYILQRWQRDQQNRGVSVLPFQGVKINASARACNSGSAAMFHFILTVS